MSFGVFSAYEHLTMSDAERALLENVEALTYPEGDPDPERDPDLNMSCFRNCWNDIRYNCTIVLSQVVTGETILEFTCEYFKKPFGI